MTKNNFEKITAFRIVSWEFLLISEDSYILWQLFLKVKRLLTSFLLVYEGPCDFLVLFCIAIPKIFRIMLSALFNSLETVLLALVFLKL